MKSRMIGRARVVLLALGLMAAASAEIGALSLGTELANAQANEGAGARSAQASEVEAKAARADLVNKLETALGDGFGGVWFEPSTAEVHVGVTSPLIRRAAEAVATRAGLAGDVTATPVDATWAQLEAAQRQLNQRLGDLLERGRASTSLAPDQNSVRVKLSPSVSPSRRAALESEASAATVEVTVEVVPGARLQLTPWARCEKFVKFKAYCDPTIVSGVSIDDEEENEEKGTGDCTAGPVVKNKNPLTGNAATETLLLTAGHCIVEEGAVGKIWHAFKKAGERKEIGKALATLNQEPEIGADVGVIKVEQITWAEKNAVPVTPTIAQWAAGKETEPVSVIKEIPPMKNAITCFSGQRSGVQCGKIVEVEKAIGGWVNILEIKLETGKGGEGDSGAPTFSQPAYNKGEGHVEGMIVGGAAAESEIAYAQPLSFLLAELKKHKGLDLELLTNANKERGHPPLEVTGEFKSSVFITGSLKSGTSAVLSRTDATLVNTCTTSHVEGVMDELNSPTVTGNLDGLSFANCVRTVTVHKAGTLHIEHIAGTTNGTVSSSGSEVTVGSPFGTLNCKTGTGVDLGTLTGVASGHAEMHINAVINCGFLAPSTKWEGTYTVTTPTGLGVAPL